MRHNRGKSRENDNVGDRDGDDAVGGDKLDESEEEEEEEEDMDEEDDEERILSGASRKQDDCPKTKRKRRSLNPN